MKRINAVHVMTAGLVAFGAAAFADAQAQRDSGRLRVVDAVAVSGDQDPAKIKSMEITVDDGDIRIKVDGKELDASRIKREGNRIVIQGDDGTVLKELQINPWGSAFQYSFGDKSGDWLTLLTDPEATAAPKVMLGIHMGEPGPALEKHLQLKDGQTTLVQGVYEGLPAHEAGLGEFDIITSVDGNTPADAESIRKVLAEKGDGDQVTFEVIQAGKRQTITVTLRGYDSDAMSSAKLLGRAADPLTRLRSGNWMGLMPNRDGQHMFVVPEIQNLPQIRQQLKLDDQLKPLLDRARERAQDRREGVEGQLDRLDQRMADLEAMIERFLKERGQN